MKLLLGLLIFFLEVSHGALAWGLTVDEAYQAIPHKRAPYDVQRSTLSATEGEFLAKLFALSDEALVERVTTLAALREGNRAQLERYEERIARILTTLRAMPEPASAHGLAATLGQAIEMQRTFFRGAFSAATKDIQLASDTHVRTASNELRRLYTDLMTRYSGEHPHNRDAFFQHLCALDFL